MLVLIPETVDGKPLTLTRLGKLVRHPKKGEATKYRSFNLGQYRDSPAPKSHWALMTRDVLPGSRCEFYADQQALVARHAKKSQLPYKVPPILDATVCIFMEYFRTGKRLYGDRTLTQCQEKWKHGWQLVVGGFAPGGLGVDGNSYGVDGNSYYDLAFGVGGLWKL